jgi:hemerythrin-like domain-containing protein
MGRELVAAMAGGSPRERASIARRYVRLLRDHIDKENAIVYPFAEAILDRATEESVRRDFATADLATERALAPVTAESVLARLSLEVSV